MADRNSLIRVDVQLGFRGVDIQRCFSTNNVGCREAVLLRVGAKLPGAGDISDVGHMGGAGLKDVGSIAECPKEDTLVAMIMDLVQ